MTSQKMKSWKDIGIQILGQYHDLYIQYDTLLLADVFESFSNESKFMNLIQLTYSGHLDWHGRHVRRKQKLN